MTILSKGCKPDNFKSHNLVLWIFRAFFRVLLNVNLSLNQTLLTLLPYARQTWMTQFILVISVRGYLPLIRKDSAIRIHGLEVYVKEGLPFALDVSLENSADSHLYF